jgi:hypothetical protein
MCHIEEGAIQSDWIQATCWNWESQYASQHVGRVEFRNATCHYCVLRFISFNATYALNRIAP